MIKMDTIYEGHKVDPALVQKYIDEMADYITVAPVDMDKTLYLVTEVKGIRSYNVFTVDADFTGATMSRLLRRQTLTMSRKNIARIAAADLTGNINLDMIMEAQGKVHKDRIDEYWKKELRLTRQIILDEMLSNGEYILLNPVSDGNCFSVKCKNSWRNGKNEILWQFHFLLNPLETNYSAAADQIYNIQEQLKKQTLNKPDRCSLVVDNEFIFNGVVNELKRNNSENSFTSVILVSIPTRRVIDEHVISREKFTSLESGSSDAIICSNRLFPLPEPKESKPLGDSNPETIIPELNEGDIRRMITDLTLQKGYQVQYKGKTQINMPLINIETSAVIKVFQPNGYNFQWALCYKSTTIDMSAVNIEESIKVAKAELKSYVIDWAMKAMIYFYQGGTIDKLSMVITDKDVFDSAVTELKNLHIPNEISIILVSTERNMVIDEYIVPQKCFKII